MSLHLNKVSKALFENRIKSFAIIQLILLITMMALGVLSFMSKQINYFYDGLFQIDFAGFWFLTSIEQFMLKNKVISIMYFILFVLTLYVAIHTFHLSSIRES